MSLKKRARIEINTLLDNDEISPEEAGFMMGYLSE